MCSKHSCMQLLSQVHIAPKLVLLSAALCRYALPCVALLGDRCGCWCRSTNYKKWFSTAEPYPIKFRSGYEPYVLVARKIMPWYDERFRGYGWDKVSSSERLFY